MTLSPTSRLALAASFALLVGCQATPRSRADAATNAACRAEVDRVYAAQNRADLSRRDQRDTPFAESYNSGITSRGLGALFGRDNQVSSCVSNSSAPGRRCDLARCRNGADLQPIRALSRPREALPASGGSRSSFRSHKRRGACP